MRSFVGPICVLMQKSPSLFWYNYRKKNKRNNISKMPLSLLLLFSKMFEGRLQSLFLKHSLRNLKLTRIHIWAHSQSHHGRVLTASAATSPFGGKQCWISNWNVMYASKQGSRVSWLAQTGFAAFGNRGAAHQWNLLRGNPTIFSFKLAKWYPCHLMMISTLAWIKAAEGKTLLTRGHLLNAGFHQFQRPTWMRFWEDMLKYIT